MNIVNFIAENARKFPLKPAIGFKKQNEWSELNWRDFQVMVAKTAGALQSVGVCEGDTVGIYSDNSAEWIVFDLAVLTLGAVTVPIYSTNTEQQAEYIIKDSELKIILVGDQQQYDAVYRISERLDALQLIVASKKKIWIKPEKSVFLEDFIKDSSEQITVCERSDEDLATLIYTSGTTGVPKGVMLTHGNFHKCIEAHFEFFKFKNFQEQTSMAFLPLSHVFERSWTLLSLYGGAKVYFLENTKLIASALQEVRPTMMCAVPRFYQKIYAAVNEMVKEGSPLKRRIFNWSLQVGTQVSNLRSNAQEVPLPVRLKFAIADKLVFGKIKMKMGGKLWFMPCGGASLSPEVTQFFDAMGIHITVGYGLTETTATLTAFPFTGYEHGSAGKVLGDTQIKIGANDEILAKGSGIMKGYYKKPQETQEVFTADGWFRTGDAGRFDEQGNLFITDRIKDLMKTSNGKYITPQPIENLLSNDQYITQAMVVAEGRPFVSALIIPNFDALREQIAKMNIHFTSWEDILNSESVKNFYHQKLEQIQKSLPGFEKVKKFTLMPFEFEVSTGEITPTLKVKRNVVLKKYEELIERMYAH